MQCKLCDKESSLQGSHIIPSFVFRWLKRTSATGYMRWPQNNKRLQDGHKERLLCTDCERLFSGYEREFANNIFYPYVNDEMDKNGSLKGEIKTLSYDEWLLKFLISVQWRTLHFISDSREKLSQKQKGIVVNAEEKWRSYLLGNRKDTGSWESHLIFLFSFEGAMGLMPGRLPEKLNFYLLRSIDTTLVFGPKNLAHFTKIGPMVIWTCLEPTTAKGMGTSRVKRRGEVSLVQSLKNTDITEFLFITRPAEVRSGFPEHTEKYVQQIRKSIEQNPEKALNSLTFKAQAADDMTEINASSDGQRGTNEKNEEVSAERLIAGR